MRVLLLGVGLVLAACETAPRPTASADAADLATLRAYQEPCLAAGHVQGSAEMIACMRSAAAGEATP